jgi:hypothetical protein
MDTSGLSIAIEAASMGFDVFGLMGVAKPADTVVRRVPTPTPSQSAERIKLVARLSRWVVNHTSVDASRLGQFRSEVTDHLTVDEIALLQRFSHEVLAFRANA